MRGWCGNTSSATHIGGYLFANLQHIYKPRLSNFEAGKLMALTAQEPILIAGDFNAHHPILHSTLTPNAAVHLATLLEGIPELVLLNTDEPTHIMGGCLDQPSHY